MRNTHLFCLLICLFAVQFSVAQTDSSQIVYPYKNVVRYNLSGALLFGFDSYIVVGYERVLSPRRSISVNFGKASMPKLIEISTDSFNVKKDKKRTGYNISVDYRFYLAKENKFTAPRGVYIGPYYSYNHFETENQWDYKNSSTNTSVQTTSDLNIHTIGFELGYQFIFWKRLALDLVMVGPGVGFYDYKAKINSNIDPAKKQQILDGLEQLITQKFPGMSYVFSDEHIDGNGAMKTSTIGYRYIVHIGFNF
jgi:uncharacterized protein DUF3575